MSVTATLIGAAGGFTACVVPEIMGMVRERFAHRRELELKRVELEATKAADAATIQSQQDTITALTDALKTAQGVQPPPPPEVVVEDDDCAGNWLLTTLRSSVRPAVTYGFFFLFAAIKLGSMYVAYHGQHVPVISALPVLWDDETVTLFSAVMSFWFGSRALAKKTNVKK